MFRKSKIKSVESGQYRFDFHYDGSRLKRGDVRGTYLRIVAKGGGGGMTIPGGTHVYGYLFEALRQGKTEQLENYASLLWSISLLVTTDQQLANDLWKAVQRWQKRKMKEGAAAAAAVTEADESSAREFMESITGKEQDEKL